MSKQTAIRMTMYMLVLIAAVPLARTQAIFRSQDQDGRVSENLGDLRQAVHSDAARVHLQRRAYDAAVERCAELIKRGEDVVCPDFNNPASFNTYVVPEATHPSAPSTAQTDTLDNHAKILLRRYTKAGFCPQSLHDFYLAGFYELCRSLVGVGVTSDYIRGFSSDIEGLSRMKASAPATLKLRLKMLEQANDRSNRRADVSGPARPKTTLQKYLEE